MRRDGVAGGFRILCLHTKQHAAELALQRGRRIGRRGDAVRVNRAFDGKANRRVTNGRHMIFDDIHKHHGMTRADQCGTQSPANCTRAPDQDWAMIHGVTDGTLFGCTRHGNLLDPCRLPQSAIPCQGQG